MCHRSRAFSKAIFADDFQLVDEAQEGLALTKMQRGLSVALCHRNCLKAERWEHHSEFNASHWGHCWFACQLITLRQAGQ